MFNNKKANNSNKNPAGMPAINMISEDSKIEGKIESKSDIRTAGSVKGEIQTDGKLILTSTSHVNGDIKAVDADISGKIDGEIFIKNKLILRKSAVIKGDIHTKSLLIEEGAQFDGICKMGDTSLDVSGRSSNGRSKSSASKKLKMNT